MALRFLQDFWGKIFFLSVLAVGLVECEHAATEQVKSQLGSEVTTKKNGAKRWKDTGFE